MARFFGLIFSALSILIKWTSSSAIFSLSLMGERRTSSVSFSSLSYITQLEMRLFLIDCDIRYNTSSFNLAFSFKRIVSLSILAYKVNSIFSNLPSTFWHFFRSFPLCNVHVETTVQIQNCKLFLLKSQVFLTSKQYFRLGFKISNFSSNLP